MRGFNIFRSYHAISRSCTNPGQKLLLHIGTIAYCGSVFDFFEKRVDAIVERYEAATGMPDFPLTQFGSKLGINTSLTLLMHSNPSAETMLIRNSEYRVRQGTDSQVAGTRMPGLVVRPGDY